MAATIDNAGLPEFKVCSKCGLTKPRTHYAPGKAHCRPCYNVVRRSHYALPDINALKNEKRRAYSQKPDITAKRKQFRALPEIKAKEKQATARWRSRPDVKERMRQYTEQYSAQPEARAKALFSSVRLRAQKKGLSFTITDEWIRARVVASRVCELTGIEFEYGRAPNGWQKHPFAPSIDQIRAGYGYTPENCRVVLAAINNGLGEWGDKVFARVAAAFLKRYEANNEQSIFTVDLEKVEEDQRIITGIATSPTPDRLADVVEPDGAKFTLPMPLLWQHDSEQPIGHVTAAKVGKAGIEIIAKIARIAEPGRLKDRLDEAWQSIKAGLVQGLSIGFKPIKHELIPQTKGLRFIEWSWLETSAVTIAANQEASITTIRSIDTAQRAAPGQAMPRRVVHLTPPGASGQIQRTLAREGTDMKTIAEQITALENKRAASAARMEAVMQKSLDEDRTSDQAEQEEFDTLSGEVEAIDKDLVRLRKIEQAKAFAAKAVAKAETAREGAAARSSIVVKPQPKLEPGILFAQHAKCLMVSQKVFRDPAIVAEQMYGPDSAVVGVFKAPVPAGATLAGNWAVNLIGEETGAVADFVEWLRPQTILGRFGTGGVPALRSVMFRVPLITQTSGGEGYWVGEGKAKPLTSFSFTRTTLEPLKVANICVLTEESVRYSTPKADAIVRDELAAALRQRLDEDFIDPAKTAVAGSSPASITNGAETIASTGDDADDIRLDIRSVWAKYTAENNPPSSGVWIMSSNSAVALAMLTNPLGQPEFGSMAMTGGTLQGMPVIASDYVGDIVVLVNASDIYLADEGGITVDASREASLEMSDSPAHTSAVPTAASLVSMWQTNSVAIRAERTINWMRRRDPGVVYLTGVSWGGPVHTA